MDIKVRLPLYDGFQCITPLALEAFLAEIADAIIGIPEEYRGSAVIELSNETYDGYIDSALYIEYTRPETPEETSTREVRAFEKLNGLHKQNTDLLAKLIKAYPVVAKELMDGPSPNFGAGQ